MSDIFSRLTTLFRGRVHWTDLPREALRRRRVKKHETSERKRGDIARRARLSPEVAPLTPEELNVHFRERSRFFFSVEADALSAKLFSDQTSRIMASASRIVDQSTWEIAGFGPIRFDGENYWRRDPLGSQVWDTVYYADIAVQEEGADIRVLWEANRFGHAIDLAVAFAACRDERFAETFFSQIEEWSRQNPYGRGPNWVSAMEVALRAINLLAAFDVLRTAESCTAERVMLMLAFFDQHGRFIFENNEFSYVSTSNHYMSNVVGLFWIGTCLPELAHATEWREFGLAEMMREVDKQVLPYGSHFESSTGYHKLVTEMLLYSLHLAEQNDIDIDAHFSAKLRSMVEYIFGLIRPDGCSPLIGDADGSQIVPVVRRDTHDQSYLLALGAVMFDDPRLRLLGKLPPEVLWILGEKGAAKLGSMIVVKRPDGVTVYPHAGIAVMRDADMYLQMTASDAGLNGRGSHAHNDALSIEVAALGTTFIVDPGSYVYNLDREARHDFRSTSYHSTVEINGVEQNTINRETPFIIGNEANPRIVACESSADDYTIAAEHYGYRRLKQPVMHRRTARLIKASRSWEIEDEFSGKGMHEFAFRFHFAAGLEVAVAESGVFAVDPVGGARLEIKRFDIDGKATIEPNFVSRTYGGREPSCSACWRVRRSVPCKFRWTLTPSAGKDQ